MSDPNWPPPAPPPYQSPPAPAHASLAGWGARAGAAIIDGFVIGVPVVVSAFAASVGSDLLVLVFVLICLGAFLYAPVLMGREGERNGQTVGRQAVGIRVIRESGEPMGVGWAALREVVCKGVLGLISFVLLLSYLWPLWDRRNQALHDKMASTLVVEA